MFAPKTSSASLRNPRRRQRTSSDDSVKPPRAKRQRSVLRQNDHESNSENQVAQYKENALEQQTPDDSDHASTEKNMPIRSFKKFDQRENDSEGSIVLSKTDFYTVSQLPCLPDQIRSLHSESFKCIFGSGHGYALALTQSHAIIWPYAVPSSSPSPSDVFALSIPESYREPNGAVPLGILLSPASNGTPGLMIIMPSTGKIIYWDTISCAGSLGLPRQKLSGIHGSIAHLLSGERVTDVVNGEPSGVIATFSSGRVAHITFRDSQGKPAVIANFLRASSGNNALGILGGIKNVLGGGHWRKDLAAVRPGRSHQRGQRDIITATSKGLFEIWDTHWNNGSILKKEFAVSNCLHGSLRQPFSNATGELRLRILDFIPMPCEQNIRDPETNESEPWHLFMVIAPSKETFAREVALVQIALSEEIQALSIRYVDLHDIQELSGVTPLKLCIPNPGKMAFIVTSQSVYLLSLENVEESPTPQLLVDSSQQSHCFRDSIFFRTGKEYEILGSGTEDESNSGTLPACLVMIRTFGVIRIAALTRKNTESEVRNTQITAKHKIEQAVFYGTMSSNPLNLTSKSGLDFPVGEIECAALEICKELLQSTSKFIPAAGISLEHNLRLRAKSLDDLAHLLMQQNNVFERRTWFVLLWGAEKLAAQKSMWQLEDSARKYRGSEQTLLSRAIELMSDKFKTKPEKHNTEGDPVRHWFLYDTWRMQHIVPWIFNAVKPQKGHQSKHARKPLEHILEASELSLAVLETAFRYRDEHASQYGFGDGFLEDGVFVDGMKGLPEFWTSQRISYVEIGHLLDLELDSCRASIQHMTPAEAPETLKRIARNCTRQIRVIGQMHDERTRWLASQEDQMMDDEVVATEQIYSKQRKWRLFKLAGIGQLEDAIVLAEKFRDMGALVELIIELQDQSKGQLLIEDPTKNAHYSETEQLAGRISQYFEKFGDSWADAFFSRQISMGQSGILFSMKRFQPSITRFLRKSPAYSRLSWINDVVGENDYNTASRSLEELAINQESDVWSRRVELSLAKLAKLASWEELPTPRQPDVDNDIRRLEDIAEIDAVQEAVYDHISPVLEGAIDKKAEIELAIDHFGKSIARDSPSLHEVLSNILARVVTRQVVGVDQLVDLLTLMDAGQVADYDQSEFLGNEFYLALRIVSLGHYASRDLQYHFALQKLVWRRCMIKDDWVTIGRAVENTGNDSNTLLSDTALSHTIKLCLNDRHTEGLNSSTYVPASPHDVLLSNSDSSLILSRFRPEERSRILHDLNMENTKLSQYLKESPLEFWFQDFMSPAKEALSRVVSHTSQQAKDDEQPAGTHITPMTDGAIERARLSWL